MNRVRWRVPVSNVGIVRIYALLLTLQAFVAGLGLFFRQSEAERSLWLGLSAPRLVIAGAFALLCLLLFVLTIKAFLDRDWVARQMEGLRQNLVQKNGLLPLATVLLYISVFGTGMILFFLTPLAEDLDTSNVIFQRTAPVVVWGILACLESYLLLRLVFAPEFEQPGAWSVQNARRVLKVLLILSFTIVHWLIFIFREAIFTGIQGWYWQYHLKGLQARDGIFLILLVVVLLASAWVLKNPRRLGGNLLVIFILGILLQVGFGWIEGEGFQALEEKYTDSAYKEYAITVSKRNATFASLLNYEENYRDYTHLGTKPPGVLLTYLASERLGNAFRSETSRNGRYERLTGFISYIYPLLSMLALFPLFWASRLVLPSRLVFVPLLLYIACPNVVLMPLLPDQFLFPLLFIAGVWLSLLVVKKKSFVLSILLGGFFFISLYFSFSLLPLAFLAILLIWLDYATASRRGPLREPLLLSLGLVAGFGLLALIFWLGLNYDLLTRYQAAMETHRAHKKLETGLAAWFRALLINNVEFTLWTGVPLILLAVFQARSAVIRTWKRKPSLLDLALLGLLATFLALNVFSQTRSEVGRLWLFLVPAMAVFAAPQAVGLHHKPIRSLWFILVLQLITVWITFHFQDFY
jgi:hypothetical protein